MRKIDARAVNVATPSIVCWVCNSEGHRAHLCPKRYSTGCAWCGSKAHSLVTYSQCPDLRKDKPNTTNKTTQGKNTAKTQRWRREGDDQSPVTYVSKGILFYPSSSMTQTLVYRIETIGGTIDAMIDSGVELSLISEDTVKRRGILAKPLESPLYIILADQSRLLASHCVPSLLLSQGSWSDSLHCVVVPSLSGSLFLGRD